MKNNFKKSVTLLLAVMTFGLFFKTTSKANLSSKLSTQKTTQKKFFKKTVGCKNKSNFHPWELIYFAPLGIIPIWIVWKNCSCFQKNNDSALDSKDKKKSKLKIIFNDTMKICQKQKKIDSSYEEKICKGSKIYALENSKCKHGNDIILNDSYENSKKSNLISNDKIIITPWRTIDGVTRVEEKNHMKFNEVTLLNFANFFTPGGGVKKGCSAQEECLCRSTDLYLFLTKHQNDFYDINKNISNYNDLNDKYLGDNRCIFSKNVTQIKEDNDNYKTIEENKKRKFNVISAAAPDLRKNKNFSELKIKKIMEERFLLVIHTAIKEKCQILVLGAFGCGAFEVPAKIVAEVAYELLVTKGYAQNFEKIIFNIYTPEGGDTKNFDVFKKAFENKAIIFTNK